MLGNQVKTVYAGFYHTALQHTTSNFVEELFFAVKTLTALS